MAVVNSPDIEPVSQAPDFFIPEVKKDKDWYAKAVRWGTQMFYNRPQAAFRPDMAGSLNPVQKIMQCWQYYLGDQYVPGDDALLNDFMVPGMYRAGNDIWNLVNNKVGKISEYLQNARMMSERLSPEAKHEREMYQDLALQFLDMQTFYQDLQKLGIIFNPLPEGAVINSKEDFENYIQYEFREYGQVVAENIADKLWYFNDLVSKYEEVTRQVLVGGLCGIDNYIKWGMVHKDVVPAHYVIWDNTQTDKFNAQARWAGRVYYSLSPDEVIALYGDQLTETEKQEILDMKSNIPSFVPNYNTPVNGFDNFWAIPNTNQTSIGGMTAVKMYFKGHRDYRIKNDGGRVVNINDYNDDGTINEKNINNKGDYGGEVWYTATLVLNKYVVDNYVCENTVYDPHNIIDPYCPMQIVVPSATLDQYKSDVARCINIQNEIDFYRNKILDKAIRDKGKNYYINGKQFGIDDPAKFFSDLASTNIFIGEPDNVIPGDPSNDVFKMPLIDLTLDPNVERYITLKQDLVNEMRESLSMPDVALGLQKTTIGKAVQENTQSAANLGLASFYNTMLSFFQRDMQLTVNMQKIAFADKDNESCAKNMIGIKGWNWLQIDKERCFEYIGIYMVIQDIVTSEERKSLLADAYAALQNQQIGWEDILNIRTARTYTEMKRLYRNSLARSKREMEQQQAMAMQAEAERTNIEAQTKMGVADRNAQAAEYSANRKAAATEYASNVSAAERATSGKE